MYYEYVIYLFKFIIIFVILITYVIVLKKLVKHESDYKIRNASNMIRIVKFKCKVKWPL